MGISKGRLPAVVDRTVAGSPAEKAGLQGGDRILAADGERMEDWPAWVKYVRARPGQSARRSELGPGLP